MVPDFVLFYQVSSFNRNAVEVVGVNVALEPVTQPLATTLSLLVVGYDRSFRIGFQPLFDHVPLKFLTTKRLSKITKINF